LATDRGATTTLAAVIALFAVVPIALAGAATPTRKGIIMAASGPVPIDTGLHVHALVTGRRVALSWSSQHSDGAPFYYEVLRSPAGACSTTPSPAPFSCGKVIGLVRRPPYVDAPRVGKYDYWIMVGANWLDVAGVGNEYVAGTPASVTVP
jgi:hypothetical protein